MRILSRHLARMRLVAQRVFKRRARASRVIGEEGTPASTKDSTTSTTSTASTTSTTSSSAVAVAAIRDGEVKDAADCSVLVKVAAVRAACAVVVHQSESRRARCSELVLSNVMREAMYVCSMVAITLVVHARPREQREFSSLVEVPCGIRTNTYLRKLLNCLLNRREPVAYNSSDFCICRRKPTYEVLVTGLEASALVGEKSVIGELSRLKRRRPIEFRKGS